MFEKTTHTVATVLYTALVGAALCWLAWACLSSMSWWLALAVFVPCALLVAGLFGPAVAAASFVVCAMVAGVAVMFSSASKAWGGKKHVR